MKPCTDPRCKENKQCWCDLPGQGEDFITQIRSWYLVKKGYSVKSFDDAKERTLGFKLFQENKEIDYAKVWIGVASTRNIPMKNMKEYKLWKTSESRKKLAKLIAKSEL